MPSLRHVPTLPILPILTILAACSTEPNPGDPFPGITATTEKASYTTAEPIVVTLTNTTSSAVYYTACPERWDQKTGNGYRRYEELTVCLAVITSIPAHGSATATYTFPDGQPTGTWHIPVPITSAVGEPEQVGEARTADFLVGE